MRMETLSAAGICTVVQCCASEQLFRRLISCQNAGSNPSLKLNPSACRKGVNCMLTYLRLRDFAIVDELSVEFGPRLNVVTGETGAGKSLMVDALHLVLGGRTSGDVIRSGAESAEVEALFEFEGKGHELIRARLAALDLDERPDASAPPDGDSDRAELIVRRVVGKGGRGRAYANGRLITLQQLNALTEGLVDISSQHEHHSLTDSTNHLGYLDSFAKLDNLSAQMRAAHEHLVLAVRARDELKVRHSDHADRTELLRFHVQEIDAVQPVVGEEETLGIERDRLRHSARLSSIAERADTLLYSGDATVTDQVSRLIIELREATKLDASLVSKVDELESVRTQLDEIGREFGRYARSITSDEVRLQEVEDRLEQLKRLMRRHTVAGRPAASLADVLAYRDRAMEELDQTVNHDAHLLRANAAVEQRRTDVIRVAKELSERRIKAARTLGRAMSAELASLGMGTACVTVDVTPTIAAAQEDPFSIPLDRTPYATDSSEIRTARVSASGMERVEFLIAANVGEDARPLRRVASGGELSRAMLAIKRVLASAGGQQTGGVYVFDEVDAGVGGAVAEVIGRKIRDVSRDHQVLCITHLAPIAVFADTHFVVAKRTASGRTVSEVATLSARDRVEEIARMLGGAKITGKTKAAAEEMLKMAAA